MMKTVYDALKPGGSLYIVDYKLADGETLPADKRHVRTGKDGVAAEVESFGFGPAEDVAVTGLSENYMLRFPRP
jgi:predicted methyltransferase